MIKWIWKNIFWLMLCGVGIALTPLAFQVAFNTRGYSGVGGEILVPLLVPAVWYVYKSAVDLAKEWFADE